MMVEAGQITKQVLDFQRGAFSSWYGAMSILQEQSAMTVEMLNQASWIPDEGRRLISIWASACKSEGQRYKAYVEEGFSSLEKYLSQEITAAPAKPKKPVAAVKKAAPAKSETPAAEQKKAASAQKTK